MCLINFQLGGHPQYKLVIAANRDEEYARPTKAADFWEEDSHILAGRDLRGMGTWLGITKNGRISALTNIRNKEELLGSHQKTRGELVGNFLKSKETPYEYLTRLKDNSGDYAGFNLLVGDKDSLFYLNNYEKQVEEIKPGIHGLSNHHLNTPWPKVKRGKAGLSEILAEDLDIEQVFALLKDQHKATTNLPDTGLSQEIEKELSPLFINMDKYGTRCSTVITIDHDNHVQFVERTFSDGEQTGEVSYDFDIA